MRDLGSFFTNPFSDPKIPLNRKKKFSEDHIQRLTVQNTGNQFTQALTDTIAVHTALFGGITGVATSAAIREARTQAVDAVIDNFKARNTRLNKYLVATEVEKTPAYQEFFPQGVQVFTKGINKENVEQRMQELVTAITANTAAAGGAAVLAEYQQMLANYKAARGSQLNKVAEVDTGSKNLQQAEENWNDQAFNNLLTVANLHRNDPGSLSLYMNQTILRAQQDAAHDGKGAITGIAHDSKGNPLAGVLVHVMDGNINDATTDESGGYNTQSLAVGTYQVQYSKEGFAAITETIEVVDDGDTAKDVAMS